ncbi:MAG: hypothetical protein PHY05_04050 [Methanothrix sp.]|nr:hypothetical protein [Methanothrix sp.]
MPLTQFTKSEDLLLRPSSPVTFAQQSMRRKAERKAMAGGVQRIQLNTTTA